MSNFQNPKVPPTGGSHLPHAHPSSFEMRRTGVGRAMLESVLAEAAGRGANAAVAECRATVDARGLLLREGFQDVGSSYRLER